MGPIFGGNGVIYGRFRLLKVIFIPVGIYVSDCYGVICAVPLFSLSFLFPLALSLFFYCIIIFLLQLYFSLAANIYRQSGCHTVGKKTEYQIENGHLWPEIVLSENKWLLYNKKLPPLPKMTPFWQKFTNFLLSLTSFLLESVPFYRRWPLWKVKNLFSIGVICKSSFWPELILPEATANDLFFLLKWHPSWPEVAPFSDWKWPPFRLEMTPFRLEMTPFQREMTARFLPHVLQAAGNNRALSDWKYILKIIFSQKIPYFS